MSKNKVNIKLTVSYDGTNYQGYQSQLSGNTVQDKISKAIFQITKENVTIYCAGRTDSGVHAEGQISNFKTKKNNMTEENWLSAVNSLLPRDIRILKCEFVDMNFHAQKSAKYREYWYTIINSPVASALDNRYAAHHSYSLKTKKLQDYCNILVGTHDFTSFCASGDKSKSKIRFMKSIKVEKKKDIIIFKFIGNAFLYHMIRAIVGTVIKLHRFEEPASKMKEILDGKKRKLAGPTYFACGLVLKKVYYEELKK